MKRETGVNLPPVSHAVHSFLLEDELVLFSERAKRLFRLNTSASFIWYCCEEGLEQKAIVCEFSQAFGLSEPRAEEDINSILSEWMAAGLLGDTGTTPPALHAEAEETLNSLNLPEPPPQPENYPHEQYYQLVDTVFRIRFSSIKALQIASSVLAHLEISDKKFIDVALDVQEEEKGFFIFHDGALADYCSSEEKLGPLLHGQALVNAYSRSECLIALHAAAISNGKECLVLPALSGRGKSTLTAALLTSGFRYCTDELVLLQARTHQAQAIAMGIGIKSGSWDVLQTFHPHIHDLPAYLRQDGQEVRYLLPEKHQLTANTTQHHPIHALVFPAYQAGSAARLERLTPADALCRLTDAGTDMAGGLDYDRVTELVDWISNIDSYELCYDSLEDAITHVQALLPQ